MKIVVADDERPARFVLVSMLEELGFDPASVSEAASGTELVEAVASIKPGCALVDVRMPGMDGLAAIEAAAPSSRLTRWVVVSSFAEFEYARTAIRLGVNEYLLKPVRPEELGACLGRLGLGPKPPEEDPLLGPVIDYLTRNYNGDVSVAEAAELAGLTPNYLSALFRKRTGTTISEYLARIRIGEAARLIRGGLSVACAAREVGYSDLRFFAAKFKEITGAHPSDYKQD
jgi:YesN/AraC family two-component response regulator